MLHECWFCGNVVEEEDLCYGCGVYFCVACNPTAIEGKHEPEAHINFNENNEEEPFENIRFEGE